MMLPPKVSQDCRDRRLGVVVADLTGRDTAKHREGVRAALEERLLTRGHRYPMDRFAGIGQPQREQIAGHDLAAELDTNLAEVDFALPGRRTWGMNTCAGIRPASTAICGLRSETYARTR
jgi:hypothetical protein